MKGRAKVEEITQSSQKIETVEVEEEIEETENEAASEVGEPYDDFPPASTLLGNRISTALTALLLNEVNATLQDVNKILAFLRQVETHTAARQTVSGETIPSSLSENIAQAIKRNSLDENLKKQLTKLQAQAEPAWNNLEASLHQSWLSLRQRSQQLRASFKREKPSDQEQYTPEEWQPPAGGPHTPEPIPVTSAYQTRPESVDADVAPAETPVHELTLDVFNEPQTGEVVLIAEHPSLQPTSIHISLAHDILTLVAVDLNNQVYTKECLLPLPVQPDTFTQKYRNGVLEIRLKAR